MNYEEKRELRLQISQLLADAGLNQVTIKQMVEEEIKHKVDRAIDQTMERLNAQCYSGDYIKEKVSLYLDNFRSRANEEIKRAVREELSSRVINISLKDVKVTDE